MGRETMKKGRRTATRRLPKKETKRESRKDKQKLGPLVPLQRNNCQRWPKLDFERSKRPRKRGENKKKHKILTKANTKKKETSPPSARVAAISDI